MTKLIVTPIDRAKKGSHKKIKEILTAANQVNTVEQENQSLTALLKSWDELETLALPYLATDDKTPIKDALDEISEDEFNSILRVLIGGSKDAIPPETSAT